jgi:pilus assembly protein CpaE
MSSSNTGGEIIKVVLVDDVAETRESIKKLLAFEQDFKVIGTASNGREGVEVAKDLKPDIVIMDINMPDMDGLEAASRITKAVPTVGVIMMSVQNDQDYLQRAMLAGARFFLSKPVNMDQLYNTIRSVYAQYAPIREQMRRMQDVAYVMPTPADEKKKKSGGDRAGHIIAVYSPQGGTGCTTLATSLASGLMKEGIKTLLIDADLQFGDVGIFLELKAPTTIVDVAANADDLDIEYFDSVVVTHNSGMKVLLGPSRPAAGVELRDTAPEAISSVIKQVAGHYDFIIMDLGKSLDNVTLSLFDIADKIILVTVPTLPCIKNVKMVLDLFTEGGFAPEKIALVINKAIENPGKNQRIIPSPERIQAFLRRPVEGLIPLVDETVILNAINTGVPVIASDRDTSKSPIKQLLAFSDHIYRSLMGNDEFGIEDSQSKDKRSWSLFGNR